MFLEALRHPVLTGAIGATTGRCAEKFLDSMSLNGERRTVELGPGNGAITERLRRRLPADSQLWTIEINPALARQLDQRCGGEVEVICGSALDLTELLKQRGVTSVDRVLCTMPLTAMSFDDQHRLVTAAHQMLEPQGELDIMLFAHSSQRGVWRRFEALLGQHFAELRASPTFWNNLPPMRAYHCRAPVPVAG